MQLTESLAIGSREASGESCRDSMVRQRYMPPPSPLLFCPPAPQPLLTLPRGGQGLPSPDPLPPQGLWLLWTGPGPPFFSQGYRSKAAQPCWWRLSSSGTQLSLYLLSSSLLRQQSHSPATGETSRLADCLSAAGPHLPAGETSAGEKLNLVARSPWTAPEVVPPGIFQLAPA